MFNNDFLFEGLLEKLDTCSVFSKKPLILWEKHAIDRCFVDRCFIDAAGVTGFTAESMKQHLLKVCIKRHLNEIQAKWDSFNSIPQDGTELPQFNGIKFVIRQPVPIRFYDKKIDDFVDLIVECTVQGSFNTIYTSKYASDIQRIYSETQSLEKVNAFLKEHAPKHATLFPDIKELYSPSDFNNRIGYNLPYIFVETFIFALALPSKCPKAFAHSRPNNWLIIDEKPLPVKMFTFDQYYKMLKKARSLKDVTKYFLVDVSESLQLRSLMDISRGFSDGSFRL